jgi:tetratricopeptide (TPR) repeat protein
MIIEQHYDDEVLIGLLEEADEDAHVPACDTCTGTLESFRDLAGALHDDSVWDERELSEAPRPETAKMLRSFAERMRAEDAAAGLIVAKLLKNPSLINQNPQWRTAGVVRRLLAVITETAFADPKHAVELSRLSTEIAESLDPGVYRVDTVRKLQAMAWRLRAYMLYHTGCYTESLDALDRTDGLLTKCAVSEFESARAWLTRAQVCGELERVDEALLLIDSARDVFQRFGDCGREAAADVTKANLLIAARRFAEALTIQRRIIGDSRIDETTRAIAVLNAAFCNRELSNLTEAKLLFARAVREFERLGLVSLRARARWHLAQVLLAEHRFDEALSLVAAVRSEFEELGMPQDVALASIDAAEALLMLNRHAEVVDLCQAAMHYFGKAGLAYTQGALTALAYLKEAAEVRTLTPSALGDVRAYFELLPKQPHLLFAYPA